MLRGQDDVARAARCLTIQSLTIRTGTELDLAPLHKLHVILGELRVGPTVGFEELRLPELHSAGEVLIAGNGNLHGVFLPKFVSAHAVTIEGNVALATVSTPTLARVNDSLTVAGNSELGLLDLASLATVGGELRIANNPKLTLFEIGKLESAKAVTVENTPALDADVVQALRAKAAP